MADNLIFPIGFDLEEAVKKAGQEWNSTYADKLEKLLAKRAITVNLGFNTRNLNNLDDVKRRLAELKITPLTPENKKAIKDLVRDLKELARIMEKIQKFKGVELPELQMAKAAKLRKDVEQADEKLRMSQERLILSQQRAERQAGRTSKAYGTQSGYLDRLIKRMAVYASFSAVGNFLTNVREVTAQFELQRVSLGAIIQDQAKANQLFSEIKAFALKSPVSIMDLTKYTKQLAAYKIGVDELFDTTKRLTDISVGLGVSMDRIVLMYGQIRATGYLRASEVRQATEAGIPLVEELAKKLTDMNGKLVTSADVMEMISKRAISFDLVKEVFDDMTSAGGMFYNMQEKQGNTLFGLWAKLGDAASVMYDEIGNTEVVNGAMKGLIQLATDLMKNWQTVAATVIPAIAAAGGVAIIKKATAIYETFSNRKIKSAQRVVSATNALNKAQKAERAATEALNRARAKGWTEDVRAAAAKQTLARANLKAAESEMKAATATGFWAKTMRGLGSILSSNIFWMAASAIGGLIYSLVTAKSEAEKLAAAFNEVDRKVAQKNADDKAKFKGLADAILSSIDGSEKQRKAIEELGRTFDGVIDKQMLTAEGLRKLNGEYGEFYEQIEANNEKMRRDEKKAKIQEMYGTQLKELTEEYMDTNEERARLIQEFLLGLDDLAREDELTDAKIGALAKKIGLYDKELAYGIKTLNIGSMLSAAQNYGGTSVDAGRLMRDRFGKYITALDDMHAAMAKVDEEYESNIGNLNKYEAEVNELAKTIAGMEFVDADAKVDVDGEMLGIDQAKAQIKESMIGLSMLDSKFGELLYKLGKINKITILPKDLESDEWSQLMYERNEKMKRVVNLLKKQIAEDGLELSAELEKSFFHIVDTYQKGTGDVTTISVDNLLKWVRENGSSKLVSAIKSASKNIISAISPDSELISATQRRFMELNRGTEAGFKQLRRLMMQNGEDIEVYRKRLSDEIKSYQKTLFHLNIRLRWARLWGNPTEEIIKDIKEITAEMMAADRMLNDLGGDPNANGGRQSDPRLQNLKEEISLTKKLYDEYHKLEKQIGATKAAEKIQQIYSNTIKTLQDRAGKYGFTFELPFTDENLKSNMQHFIDKMKELQKLRDKKGKPLFPNIGREIDEAVAQLGDVDLNSLQKALEKKLKELSDRISRTKTAKEFYEKILGMTGDIQLAANLTVSVYGQNGQDLQDAIREQIRTAFETDPEKNVTIDLSEAIDPDTGAINYNKLAELEEKYRDVLIDGRADLRKKLIDEGRKTSEAQVQQWLKDIEKAKDFAQQRIDLATYTANQIAAINAREDLPQADKDKLIRGYQNREAKQLAKLQYDEFRDSAIYVHMFEDLDHASTTALKNMRDRLVALKGQWKDLDPTQVKELTKAIADLDEQIAGRSPFKSILDGFKGLADARPQKVIDTEMIAATDELAKREEALAAATKKLTEAQTAQVNAQAEVAQARQNLEDALAVSGGEETAEVKAAREVLGIKIATFNAVKAASKDSISAAKGEVDMAADKYEEQKKAIDKLVKEGKLREANIKKIELANQKIDEYQSQINEALDGVRKMMEAFGASEEDMQFFDDVVGALNEIVDAGQQAAMSVASFMSGNILGGITSGISAIGGLVSGFTNLFSAGKVRRANKEIKRQQKLLEQLEYTYGRLEKAADKVFGADYVANQKQQQKILLAQQQAYMKQYEAEMSKGKKADEEKAQEFLDKARDIGDQIADMQGKIAEQMLDTDLTSAARDLAKAWLDAYKQFGNTADAMSEKFHEMIENMIVESLMAKAMQKALEPTFKMIDEMGEGDFYDEDFWRKVMESADKGSKDANAAGAVIMEWAKKWGYDGREKAEGFTGIAKSVAGATSEEINNVAAIGNTLMYYVSPIPRIDENLARVVALMEGRGAALPVASGATTGAVDYTDLFNTANQHLSSLPRMEQHLAEIHTMLGRALRTKGSTTGFNTFLNS